MDKCEKSTPQVTTVTLLDRNKIIGKPKEKRRSNEKRKEKSRDAARCRRSRETEIFTELANVIPVRREDVEQLDKASVMRLAIAFLKVRGVLKLFPVVKDLIPLEDTKRIIKDDEKKPLDLMWNNEETNNFLAQTLDGFLMILSSEGDVTYASDSISDILGIVQIDILGQQVWEFIHQCDHDELKDALNMRKINLLADDNKPDENDTLKTVHRDLFLRFKCTLTSRGRSVNIKSASYKVIHLTGHVVMNADGEKILIGVGRPLPHPSNIEIPLGTTTFLTKHSLDMKFTYVDEKLKSLLQYTQEDLLGKSLYNCHYASDSESLMGTFKTVISKGQGETCRYRFLGKYGGYCWLVTQATVIYEKLKPQSVVCVNYVISNLENENEIYSCEQLEATNSIKQEDIKLKQQNEEIIQDKQIEINENKLKNNVDNNNLIDENDNNINNNCELNNKILNCNNSDDKLNENIKLSQNRENSLSPIRRTFINKCSISQQDGLLHQQRNNNNNNNNNNYLSNISTTSTTFGQKLNIINNNNKIILEKRPKSVTASVFTQKRLPITVSIPTSNTIGTTNSIISGRNTILLDLNNISQINCAPRAQSVTASIFKTISQIDNSNCDSSVSDINSDNNNISEFCGINNQIKTKIYSPIPELQQEEQQLQTEEEQQRTEDMNKGFLSFADDTPELTMLKEEPDDLTHLTPTAGDSCIQLDEPTPLFGEMLEGLILPDAYCSLLPDDINSLDSQHSENSNNNNNSTNNQNNSNNNNNNKGSIDPFINYRDESSDTNSSPHLLSPCSLSKNPEVSSLPSLCSPHSMNQDDEFAFMTMNVDEDIDLSMRAPYIPMNEQDDLPLLTDDLMWSAFSEELSLHKDMKDVMQMHEIAIKNHQNNCYNSISTNKTEVTSTTTNRINHNNNNNNHSNNNINNNNNNEHNNNNNINNNNSNNLTNNQQNSNSDLLNNESNLSQILCGSSTNDENTLNSLHQNDINCKKRKFIDDDDSFNDTIDAFGQVFNNKNYCWTMNDLLQLNQENNKQQNLLSQTTTGENIPTTTAATTTTAIPTPIKSATGTIHVPLITIENNQKMNNVLNTRLNLTTINNNKNNIKNNCNDIKDENNSKINLNNHSNFITTIKRLAECNSTSTISQNNNLNVIGNCIRSQDVNNNKRHLSGTSSLDTKRVKNNNSLLSSSSSSSSLNAGSNQIVTTLSIENKTAPNLLQQLMAPTPQQQRQQQQQQKSQKYLSYDNNKLNKRVGSEGHQQQQSQSNSVLKNLLVSGCDATSPLPPLITEDCSKVQIIQPMKYNSELLSPCSPTYYNDTIHKRSVQFLRHCCTNPMIGGTGLLLSPTIIPQINSPTSSDTSGDSEIECNHVRQSINFHNYKNISPLIEKTLNNNEFYPTKLITSINRKNNFQIKSSKLDTVAPNIDKIMPSTVFQQQQPQQQQQNQIQQLPANESIPFTDIPFESQLLMELCNDDYNMDTNIEDDFLVGENVLSKDFNDWTANVI